MASTSAAAVVWALRAVVYAGLIAYLAMFCAPVSRAHPEFVAAMLSENSGRFTAYALTAALAHIDLGTGLLLACCTTTACAEIDALAAAAAASPGTL